MSDLPKTEKWLKAYDNNRRQIYALDANKKIYQLRVNAFNNDIYAYVKGEWIITSELQSIIGDWIGVVYDGSNYEETGGELMVQSGNKKINMAYVFTYTISISPNDNTMGSVDETELEIAGLTPITVTDNVLTFGEGDDAVDVTATAETGYHFVSRGDLPTEVNGNMEITATFAADE